MLMADDTKTLTLLVHLSALFTWILGPLIFLMVSKDEHVKKHARLALNWQISWSIYMAGSGVLMMLLIGFLLMPVLGLLNLVFCIIAAVKANGGTEWKYPLAIAFFK